MKRIACLLLEMILITSTVWRCPGYLLNKMNPNLLIRNKARQIFISSMCSQRQRALRQTMFGLGRHSSNSALHPASVNSGLFEKSILVAVDIKKRRSNDSISSTDFTFEESISEMKELVRTAGLEVTASCFQKLDSVNKKTYIGPGKLGEIFQLLSKEGANIVIIDDDLSSKQVRGIEDGIREKGIIPDLKVMDRTSIILEIFAKHARSKEGMMQVELAMLQYKLGRLGPLEQLVVVEKESMDPLSCESHFVQIRKAVPGENAGLRGPGETKLELDKRQLKSRISELKKEIVNFGSQRVMHRASRKRIGLPVVSLVGYTNAGKSTIFNKFSNAGVEAENILFCTLDPVIRRVKVNKEPGNLTQPVALVDGLDKQLLLEGDIQHQLFGLKDRDILLTDTVGFISKLPSHLIAAFRATLEEAVNADVILHVIDRSNPSWEKQRAVVISELQRMYSSINSDGTVIKLPPIIEIWNKIDLLQTNDTVLDFKSISNVQKNGKNKNISSILKDPEHVVKMSAKTGAGFQLLLDTVARVAHSDLIEALCVIPYLDTEASSSVNAEGTRAGGAVVGSIYEHGEVVSIDYDDSSTRIHCRLPFPLFEKLRQRGYIHVLKSDHQNQECDRVT